MRSTIPFLTRTLLLLTIVAASLSPARTDDPAPSPAAQPAAGLPPDLAAVRTAERKIREALARPLRLTETELTLDQLAAALEAQLNIRVGLATAALLENGIDPAKVRLTVDADRVTARTAIDTALRGHGLDWIIRDERLTLTTAIDADAYSMTRLYDISDLVPDSLKPEDLPAISALLIEAIQGNTAGPWRRIDGTGGTIHPVTAASRQVLVVSQSRRNHEQIETLLADLRKSHAAEKPSK